MLCNVMTTVSVRPKEDLIGSHTARVRRKHRRAAPITGSAQNRVLVPFNFGRRYHNDDPTITRVQVA